MKPINKLLLLVSAVLALTLSVPAAAGDSDSSIKPVIPKALSGTKCVDDPEVMVRTHMDKLKHQRDLTLREGIRTKQFSLKECINCHVPAGQEAAVQPGEETAASGKSSEGHFCMNCHAFAGVKIDCFECHNTRPEKPAMFHPIVTPGMEATKDVHQPDSATMLNELAGSNEKTGAAQ
ncbi:MAG TPA: hypothetical protein VGE50_09375 [Gammaproteobacteria bacterium]